MSQFVAPFVLLDDALGGQGKLFTDLRRTWIGGFQDLDQELADGWERGWHSLVWFPYAMNQSRLGAIYWFAAASEVEAQDFLPAAQGAGLLCPESGVDQQRFETDVARIIAEIGRGQTYQVNYTHDLSAHYYGDPLTLYAGLRERQPVTFGLLAKLPKPAAEWTLSLSPELFWEVTDEGRCRTQPMKGTLPGDRDPTELAADPKNRAENLMIVDLLRNDLSRVAIPGSVAVPKLFEVSRVGQLWQMTSTVTAQLAPGTTPGQLLDATFPCGSITGAPKLASMDLISQLEHRPRGIYTGALGWLRPAPGLLGWEGTLSVAIRTIELDDDRARLGVGSGIVADSVPIQEWEECRAKAGFWSQAVPALIETIRLQDGRAPLLDFHQDRLARSARELGYPLAPHALAQAVTQHARPGQWALRFQLNADGSSQTTLRPLSKLTEPVTLLLSPAPWRPGPLARHKTTDRKLLDAAWRAAQDLGHFDMIGYNESQQLLEGGRSHLFVLLADRWCTPPLSLGILEGVQRAQVLANPVEYLGVEKVWEQPITIEELQTAQQLAVSTATRGLLSATFMPTP